MKLPLWPPTLGICGFSDSGKTTLLEALVPLLVRRGLAGAVVKHAAPRLELAREGKDTARIFGAGADVLAHDAEQSFLRRRGSRTLGEALDALGCGYDLILVEGHRGSSLPKLWLTGKDERKPPRDAAGVLDVLPWTTGATGRVEHALDLVLRFLTDFHRRLPARAGVLVGGRSSRMGSPKALLPLERSTLLERVVAAAREVLPEVVLLGRPAFELPERLRGRPLLEDPPGLGGPLGGIISACRWSPETRWLILPCDLPGLRARAIRSLLDEAGPGRWAVLPQLPERDEPEPVGALYDPPMLPIFLAEAEEKAEENTRPSPRGALRRAARERLHIVRLDGPSAEAWRGVNTPEEWRAAGGDG